MYLFKVMREVRHGNRKEYKSAVTVAQGDEKTYKLNKWTTVEKESDALSCFSKSEEAEAAIFALSPRPYPGQRRILALVETEHIILPEHTEPLTGTVRVLAVKPIKILKYLY